MPHSQIRCLEECIRKLPCGHKCTALCFQECKCSCGPAPSLSSTNEAEQKLQSQQQQPPNGPWTFRRKFTVDQDHTALVERYREYANGGSKREDMKLTAVSRGQAAKDELKRADNESFEAIFGNHTITETNAASAAYSGHSLATGTGKDRSAAEGVIDSQNGSPIRRKYMQYYSTGGHVRTESEKVIGKNNGRTKGGKTQTTSLVDVD